MFSVLIGFLAGVGMLATSVQVFTGVALTLCNSNIETNTSTAVFAMPGGAAKTGPSFPPAIRVAIFVFVPVLMFPIPLLAQATCPRAFAKNCDTRCFVIVFTAMPAMVMQIPLVATADCLFDRDSAIAAVHVTACAATFVSFSFPHLDEGGRNLRRQLDEEIREDEDNKSVAFI